MKFAPLMEEYVKKNPVDDWEDDCNRYIGFIDIMGFKNLVARRPHSEIKHMLLQMNQTRTILLKLLDKGKKSDSKTSDSRVRSISFSDSVVFVTKSDTSEDFSNLSIALRICQEATIQSGLPTKGAISYGNLTVDFDRSIFFGQPLIDAYQLQEELLYYGIVLDNNAENRLKPLIQQSSNDFPNDNFVNVLTPFKGGKVNHFNISLGNIQDDQLDYLYNSVSGSVRKYVDNTIEMYRVMEQNRNKDK
ncbi:MAG: hypothetical protein WED10_15360 [Brumimicrobium sp.]